MKKYIFLASTLTITFIAAAAFTISGLLPGVIVCLSWYAIVLAVNVIPKKKPRAAAHRAIKRKRFTHTFDPYYKWNYKNSQMH